MIDRSKAPASSCINVCVIGDKKTCTGCFRTSDEVAHWTSKTIDEQWQIVDATAQRSSGRTTDRN